MTQANSEKNSIHLTLFRRVSREPIPEPILSMPKPQTMYLLALT